MKTRPARARLAALSAVALGAAAVGLAAPASASGATVAGVPTCATMGDHYEGISASHPGDGAYFTSCVPHFGLGKTEESFHSAHSFDDVAMGDDSQTAEYATLGPRSIAAWFRFPSNEAASATASAAPAASSIPSYAPASGLDTGQIGVGGTTGGPGPYSGLALLRITKVEKLTTASLSAGCQASTHHYDGVYRYSFAPIDTTFQMSDGTNQVWAGKPGSFHFSQAVPQLTVGLNFLENTPASNQAFDHFDPDAAQCSVFHGHVAFGATSQDAGWYDSIDSALYPGPVHTTLDLGTAELRSALSTPAIVVQSLAPRSITVTVKSGSVYQHGVVTVNVAGTRIATEALLSGGRLTVRVPSTLSGTHSFSIAFPGGPGALPRTVSGSIAIRR